MCTQVKVKAIYNHNMPFILFTFFHIRHSAFGILIFSSTHPSSMFFFVRTCTTVRTCQP